MIYPFSRSLGYFHSTSSSESERIKAFRNHHIIARIITVLSLASTAHRRGCNAKTQSLKSFQTSRQLSCHASLIICRPKLSLLAAFSKTEASSSASETS
jgi:hypothetical protein